MTRWLFVWLAVASCHKKGEDQPGMPDPEPEPVITGSGSEKKPDNPDSKAALVERGAYVAKLAGCASCHTAIGPKGPELENAWAGGLEIPDTVGTWRSPNITPDKSSGIGGWSDTEIIAAVREGVRPDGGQLYPIMPYLSYNRMTDDDAKALVAFMRTIKPIQKVVAPTKDLKMAKIPAPKPSSGPDPSDPVKHGEYLASLMLCSHCHMTLGPDGAPQPDKLFSGGLAFQVPILGTGTLYAANITPDKDTGIGAWSEDQIAAAIKTAMKPDGKVIQGPMLFLLGGWSQLDDKDVKAVAAYIHQLPAVKNKVAASTFQPKH